MSGTSLDGVDAVLVRFDEHGAPSVEADHFLAYPPRLREQALALQARGDNELDRAARLAKLADELEVDLGRFELVDVPHSHAAAERAVSLVRDGYADILMKGSLHTDEFMGEALARGTGIRTDRRISHVWIMKVETYPRYLFITDAAINIEPDLLTKRDICQNAIDLTQALGISQPKVAVLAAVETINPAMRSTL
ncbi:phosphate acetyltransferase, partial [Pseudomonas sp. MWU13-2860]